MNTLTYTVVFEEALEGGYVVHVPALPGCWTQGETLEEAREMAKEAIQAYVESLVLDGEPIPYEHAGGLEFRHERLDVSLQVA